jgi:hypothetical protein
VDLLSVYSLSRIPVLQQFSEAEYVPDSQSLISVHLGFVLIWILRIYAL